MSCINKVKPFYKEWCSGCIFNGCYPWNRQPLLLCSKMGGLYLQISQLDRELVEECCLTCKPVTEGMWKAHLKDLKSEAEWNEEVRLRAMRGGALSSELLPAEEAVKKLINKGKASTDTQKG